MSDHVKRRRSSAALSNQVSESNGSGSNGRGSGSHGRGSNDGSSSSRDRDSRNKNRPQHHQQQQQHKRSSSRIRSRKSTPPPDPSVCSIDDNRSLISIDINNEPDYRSDEGGYDSHAASYGNYDAPSHYCKSYGASEHGCYAAESYIGGSYDRQQINARQQHQQYHSRPSLDLEGPRVESSHHRRRLSRIDNGILNGGTSAAAAAAPPPAAMRMSQASTVPMGQQQQHHVVGGTREEESAMNPSRYSSYSTPHQDHPMKPTDQYHNSVSTASTVSSSGISSATSSICDEADTEAIRRGIIDISTLIATYLAGCLSFIIGILLTIISPFLKVVKLIVGDVRGLLGEMGIFHELGSLRRVYRELRRKSSSKRRNSDYDGSSQQGANEEGTNMSDYTGRYDRYHQPNRYYDDESTQDGTAYTDNSSQFVGGWQPGTPSLGSASGTTNSASSGTAATGTYSSRSGGGGGSRSYSALPMVHEQSQYHHQGILSPHPAHQQQQIASYYSPSQNNSSSRSSGSNSATPSRSPRPQQPHLQYADNTIPYQPPLRTSSSPQKRNTSDFASDYAPVSNGRGRAPLHRSSNVV